MNFIIDLDQHAMGLNEATDKPIDYTRQAARAVMRNGDGQIAIMHFTTTGSYKLPGGGIDEGEEALTALHRELREETGYTITDVAELGTVTENRYYCGMHQISYCYTALAGDFVGTELTEKEQSEGMELCWADTVEQAIEWIESGDTLDEDSSATGLAMMKARDIAILRAADSV